MSREALFKHKRIDIHLSEENHGNALVTRLCTLIFLVIL